jgi:hypothetical protein
MNTFFKAILLITLSIFIVSCTKSDNTTVSLRDYSEQYNKDIALIEQFLQTHYIEVINHPGFTDDQDVTYLEIPDGGSQTSIWNSPDLVTDFTVDQNDITYKVYYLKLRQGSVATSMSPCNVDKVLTAYRGEYLYTVKETVEGVEVDRLKHVQFEESINPQTYFNLTSVIKGWSEVFPKFTTGTYSANVDGTITFNDFGAGVMFLPSGLAYYANSTASIPAYSPLVFSFKLYEIQRNDQDGDGIDSYLEDINGDGYVRILGSGVVNPDDTDGDEIPDFLDVDDDADTFKTKIEILNPLTGVAYPFADIPLCSDNKKKHLSTVCH